MIVGCLKNKVYAIIRTNLLAASSWYLWKLTSNFLDEPTKKELSNSFNNIKKKFQERSKVFQSQIK